MDAKDRLNISILNDCYGSLLTPHQREMIRLYYDLDISLNEIAEQFGISRQAVRDAVQRGEKMLVEYESKLHVVENNGRVAEELKKIRDMVQESSIRERLDKLITDVEGE